MAKRKRRTRKEKQEKTRHLEYLKTKSPKEKQKVVSLSEKPQTIQSQKDLGVRKETRKSLIFVLGFVALLVLITLLVTRTNWLDPFLTLIGFSDLY